MNTEKLILLFGYGAYIFAVDCLSIYQPLFQHGAAARHRR